MDHRQVILINRGSHDPGHASFSKKIFKGSIISGLTLETRLSNLFEVRIALIVLGVFNA